MSKIIIKPNDDDILACRNKEDDLYILNVNNDTLFKNFFNEEYYNSLLSSELEDLNYEDDFNEYNYEKKKKMIIKNLKKEFHKELINNNEIIFNLPIKDSILFLKNNKEILNKKIVLNTNIDIDDNELTKIYLNLKDIKSLYIKIPENDDLISLDEYVLTVNKINSVIKTIKEFDLSPFESIIYLYNKIKKIPYKFEETNDDYTKSRDLTKILLDDKIVCLGYSRLFEVLLNKLGINNKIELLTNEKSGHARNVIYIKDDKYDVDGLYFFDVTQDNSSNAKKHYLYNYHFFAKTIFQMNTLYQKVGFNFESETFPYDITNLIQDSEKVLFSDDYKNIGNYLLTVNNINKIINKKNILNISNFIIKNKRVINKNIDKVMDMVEDYIDRPICAKTFLDALFNVEKKMYYNGIYDEDFNLSTIYNEAIRTGLNFDYLKEERLLTFLNENESKKSFDYSFKTYCDKEELPKNIERIKLTKVLKDTLEKKKNL